MKRVAVYLQETENIEEIINKMKKYIYQKGWELVNGYVDVPNEGTLLDELAFNLINVDILLIYHNSNIKNDFDLELLYKIAEAENVIVEQYLLLN